MIGILGGTGDFGQGLAGRLRALGEEVLLGSRNPRAEFVSNREASRSSDLVFLSVPPEGAQATARELAGELAGKVVVSVASPVVFRGGAPAAAPGELSLAELAARAAPDARVVAGFHTVSARALAVIGTPLREDVLLAGDDADAKDVVARLAERVVEGRAVDTGRLEVARWLEPLTAVLLNVNRRYRTQSGVKITGVGE
ncbi:MAG: NAD(P)-binding domain-containing protein [Actinomycetota bacterium]|nr:NAD(P)-binding domain-containing protein [Actinomycetota bacterium]